MLSTVNSLAQQTVLKHWHFHNKPQLLGSPWPGEQGSYITSSKTFHEEKLCSKVCSRQSSCYILLQLAFHSKDGQ